MGRGSVAVFRGGVGKGRYGILVCLEDLIEDASIVVPCHGIAAVRVGVAKSMTF